MMKKQYLTPSVEVVHLNSIQSLLIGSVSEVTIEGDTFPDPLELSPDAGPEIPGGIEGFDCPALDAF